jgi:hypothetical protein
MQALIRNHGRETLELFMPNYVHTRKNGEMKTYQGDFCEVDEGGCHRIYDNPNPASSDDPSTNQPVLVATITLEDGDSFEIA